MTRPVQLALFGDPATVLGDCPVCGQPVPGVPSEKWPRLVKINAHPHPNPALGLCVGSGTAAGCWVKRDGRKAGEAA
jgi:hypothetical protein